MKKNHLLYLSLAILLVSCSRMEDFSQSTYRMTVKADGPATKTVISEDGNDQYSMLWQAGDQLGAIEKADGTTQQFTSDALAQGNSTANFSFTFSGTTASSYDYSFVYPASALSYSGGKYLATLPAAQTFASGSFDPAADVLVSEHLQVQDRPTTVHASFARLGGTARMSIHAPTTTETIQKIIFSTTQANIVGSYELNPATGELSDMTSGGKVITLTPASATTYSGEIVVWFRLAEITFTENFTVSVVTDDKTYTKTLYLNMLNRTLVFQNSKLTRFGIDMTGVTGVENTQADVIDATYTGVPSNSYTEWSKQGSVTNAVYAGFSNKQTPGYIGLRISDNHSGIVSTTSGGELKSVTLTVYSDANYERTIDVYAKNTPYTTPEDLHYQTRAGTLIGSVTTPSKNTTTQTINVPEGYTYVGIRSNSNTSYLVEARISWDGGTPKPFVFTGETSGIGSNTATLSGNYTNAPGGIYEAGFYYGTDQNNLTSQITVDGTSATQSSFNGQLTSLEELTTYYYKAYILWLNTETNTYEEFLGTVDSFTTTSRNYTAAGWLELPGYTTASMSGTTDSALNDLYHVTHTALMGGTQQRNYTLLYDPETFISYWVAYPLCQDHMTSGRVDSWGIYDPKVPESKQVNLSSGYGVNVENENYFARGHQIPNADRNNVSAMQEQTYYPTNITPQLQEGFNGGIWMDLESGVRSTVKTDTVYVVTGAAFYKKGVWEAVKTISSKGKTLPLPNYYWKALLKVSRTGNNEINGACAIGFWLPHDDSIRVTTSAYENYVVSVDQIEAWTGFDLFKNLPTALQDACEDDVNWTTFKNY